MQLDIYAELYLRVGQDVGDWLSDRNRYEPGYKLVMAGILAPTGPAFKGYP